MKTIKTILFILIMVNLTYLFASFDDYEPSPRARAMGGAFYSISNDANAVFYNPAGLNFAGNSIYANYTKIFGNDFQILNTVAFSMNLPKKFGTLGVGLKSMDITYLDVTLSSEKTYSLSHSFILMKDVHSELHFGYTGNFYNLSINSYGSQNALGFDVGALAILHRRTKLAFTLTNINNPKVGEDNAHELPQKLAIGLTYEPYYGVSTVLEMKKTFDQQGTEIHAGTEFEVFEMLKLRAGLRNNPVSYSMGFGLNYKNIMIDYAFNTHEIGGTHHFGIGYKI